MKQYNNKTLNKEISKKPLDFDKIKMHKEKGLTIPYETIMSDEYNWTWEEKAELLRIFDYAKELHLEIIKDPQDKHCYPVDEISILKYITEKNITNFKALIATFNELEDVKYGKSNVGTVLTGFADKNVFLIGILFFIKTYCDNKKECYDFIIDHVDKDILYQIMRDDYKPNWIPRYVAYNKFERPKREIQNTIDLLVETQDLTLIRKIWKYIDNPNFHFGAAVRTNNQNVITYFIERGALEYYGGKYFLPLKESIKENSMVAFDILTKWSIPLKLRDCEKLTINYAMDIAKEQMNKEKELNSKEKENRLDIIDKIYYSLDRSTKKQISFFDLLDYTFYIRNIDLFKIYLKDMDRLEIKIDYNALIYNILKEQLNDNITPYLIELLTSINPEERKKCIVVPYVKTRDLLEEVLELGFDINQQDKYGNTLLHHTFSKIKELNYDFVEFIIRKKINPSIKNKDGDSALIFAIYNVPLYDYDSGPNINEDYEKALVKLIHNMDKNDFKDTTIDHALEYKFGLRKKDGKECKFSNTFSPGSLYEEHNDLFIALYEKGYKLPESIMEKIINRLTNMIYYYGKPIYSKEEVTSNLNLLFSCFDKNTEIQNVNANKLVKDTINIIEGSELNDKNNVEYLKEYLIKVNDIINQYKRFAKETIPKKMFPDEYKKFALKKYEIDYDDLDKIYFEIIAHLMLKTDNLELIKEIISISSPVFDKNYVGQLNIDIPLSTTILQAHELGIIGYENGEAVVRKDFIKPKIHTTYSDIDRKYQKIWFKGNLIQFAELINNLELIKYLHQSGISLKVKDYTWCYINSIEVKEYVERSLSAKNDNEQNNVEYDLDINLKKTQENN